MVTYFEVMMELVFKALSDASRRKLLDVLRKNDGQTLSELENCLSMSRFGVMKHLKVLENASLITTRRVGREKYHYLNPVPIQEIAERWISAYAQPWVGHLTSLKHALERPSDAMTSTLTKPKHVYTLIIKTTPEQLWQALTDPTLTPQYYYGFTLDSPLTVGSPFQYKLPNGQVLVGGEVLEVDPPRRLVTSFVGLWDPAMASDAPSRVVYEIESLGECCRLTLTHEGFDVETATYTIVGGGWPGILSGLKTFLETGKPLNFNPMG